MMYALDVVLVMVFLTVVIDAARRPAIRSIITGFLIGVALVSVLAALVL